jgi:hypothetical protein
MPADHDSHDLVSQHDLDAEGQQPEEEAIESGEKRHRQRTSK